MRWIGLVVVTFVGMAATLTGCSASRAPAATDTPSATNPPFAPETATPPAPLSGPTTTGKGNATITFTAPTPGAPTAARFQSTASRPFSVDALDADGTVVTNLVDVPDTYDGTVLVDGDPGVAPVAKLQIRATGTWSVALQPASTAPTLTAAGAEGERDTVLRYDGGKLDATFSFDGDGSAVVLAYPTPAGGPPDTLVSQAGASQTASPIELPGPALLQIQAQGPWAIRPADG